MPDPVDLPTDKLTVRPLAGDIDWQICDFNCTASVDDRPFEQQHDGFTIAVVLDGVFTYRSETGRQLLHPGALLLGNHGRCYECGHEHSDGDRCISISYRPDFFAEIACGVTGSGRFTFPNGMLPQGKKQAFVSAGLAALTDELLPHFAEDFAVMLAEKAIAAASGQSQSYRKAAPQHQRRIASAIRYMEENFREPVGLRELAEASHLSKYHFLRTFRQVTGNTPYQYLLSIRMRRVAIALATSNVSISQLAYEMGFGDLSTFNGQFRGFHGMNPSEFRKKMRR